MKKNKKTKCFISDTTDPREYAGGELPGNDLMLPQTVLIYSSGDVAGWRDLLYVPPVLKNPNAVERTEDEDEPPAEIDPDAESAPHHWIANGIVPPDSTADDSVTETDRTSTAATDASQAEGYRTGDERIWLVEGSHLRLALLAAFLGDVAGAKEADRAQWAAVLAQVQIEEMIAFSLRLMFDPTRVSPSQQRTLDMLRAAATTRLDQFGTQLWVYDINKSVDDQTPQAVLLNPREGDTMQAFQLFRALVELSDAGLLRDVHLVLMRNEKSGEDDTRRRVTLASSLSDGERAYLERMALIALFRSRECLFLLDEPETHFNDTWKRGLADQIEQALIGTNSMVVLTTHESVTLTDALPEEVILLSERGQENVPLTLGTEPGELLRAVFGARASVGERALRRIGDDMARARQTQDDTILRELLTKVGQGYQRYRIAEALVARDETDEDDNVS